MYSSQFWLEVTLSFPMLRSMPFKFSPRGKQSFTCISETTPKKLKLPNKKHFQLKLNFLKMRAGMSRHSNAKTDFKLLTWLNNKYLDFRKDTVISCHVTQPNLSPMVK